MEIKTMIPSDKLWPHVRNYAGSSSWSAGPALARAMDEQAFSDWERVIAAYEDERILGYCTVAKTDCIPNVPYTPYIGFVFVGEEYRGKRLSQKMILFACEYLRSSGFDRVYLVSDHENLYEKYGFRVIDRGTAFWGGEEKIYMLQL